MDSLEVAVENDWQERLLYQQEQARSEQEAMAEIERSRRGRHDGRRAGDTAYNAITLLITSIALFAAVRAGTASASGADLWPSLLALWPVLVPALGVIALWPVLTWTRRWLRQRTPDNELYSYEFTFRLDDRIEVESLRTYLSSTDVRPVKGPLRVKLRRLGGCRWEHAAEASLLKVHSVASVRLGWTRYARFEIVTEIVQRNAALTTEGPLLFLRQCRIFGDAPSDLPRSRVSQVIAMLLRHVVEGLGSADSLDVMDPVEDLFGGSPIPRQRGPRRLRDDRSRDAVTATPTR